MRIRAIQAPALLACLILCECATRSHHAVAVHDERRAYELHLPPAYDGATPMPLVMALHPFGGTSVSMARMTGFDALADAENFIVVYPEAKHRVWRAMNKTRADVDFLIALLDALESTHAVDPSRVYITGASNGANMVYRMLCEAGSRFAAAATVMGAQTMRRFDEGCPDAPPVPLLMIHGTDDKILPWNGRAWPKDAALLSMEETLKIWLARNGCAADGRVETVEDIAPADGTTATRTVFDRSWNGAPVVLYTVEGGGHTWPGGKDNAPAFLVGKTCYDFSASRIIWDFFSRHFRGPAP